MNPDHIKGTMVVQESTLVLLARQQCKLVIDGIKLASTMGASDYQIVRDMAPMLKTIGNLGDAAENMIKSHDAAARLENALKNKALSPSGDDDDGIGRDKD